MSYDLLIKNGTVIDGTGAFRRRADVAVKDGKVAEIGKVTDGAARDNRRVGPDRLARLRRSAYSLRCSDLLGPTSQLHLVARRHHRRDGKLRSGDCAVQTGGARGGGVGPGQRRGDSVRGAVEGDHAGSGRAFRNSSAAAERRGAGINLAFLAPLTPFRHYVLGDESMEREATPDGDDAGRGLLREAVDAGAFGFSTTTVPQHIGYQGRPLACRLASTDELKAYANVLRDAGQRRDRNRADAARGPHVGGRAGIARIPARRERRARSRGSRWRAVPTSPRPAPTLCGGSSR